MPTSLMMQGMGPEKRTHVDSVVLVMFYFLMRLFLFIWLL